MLTANKKLNYLLLTTYAAYAGLLGLMAYTFIINEDHTWKLWIFQSIPLLLVLPGLLKVHFRAHSWLCFVILVYFMAYVVEVGSPLAETTDWIGLTLSIIIFCGAMATSRGLQRL
ncbi:DUF2069 domain-containing protein [Eionea flava]